MAKLEQMSKDIFNQLIFNYFSAIFVFLAGVFLIWHTIKKTKPDPNSQLQPYTNGIVGGIGFIGVSIGIVYVILFE